MRLPCEGERPRVKGEHSHPLKTEWVLCPDNILNPLRNSFTFWIRGRHSPTVGRRDPTCAMSSHTPRLRTSLDPQTRNLPPSPPRRGVSPTPKVPLWESLVITFGIPSLSSPAHSFFDPLCTRSGEPHGERNDNIDSSLPRPSNESHFPGAGDRGPESH